MNDPVIDRFRDNYSWLSNYYFHPIRLNARGIDDLVMPAAEVPFAALKTTDLEERRRIAQLPTPAEARSAGRRKFLRDQVLFLRPDWEAIKTAVMIAIIDAKFSNPLMAKLLLSTEKAILIEGTALDITGHIDRIWGIDAHTRKGENRLGRIQMVKRVRLAIEQRYKLEPLPSDSAVYGIIVRATDGLSTALPLELHLQRQDAIVHLDGQTYRATIPNDPRADLVFQRSSPAANRPGLFVPATERARIHLQTVS
jgi:ribA/ribD-fused uncharacterized protein